MSVLFLVPCSLTKAPGGTTAYDKNSTIAAVAAKQAKRLARSLAERREEVRAVVKDGNAEWQGVLLRELPYNANLVKGREFGGRESADYAPALERYQGRFYQALGDAGKAAARRNDRTLILSGLYGLLRAGEPTQLYSCPLSGKVADIWGRDGLLTDLLLACIQRQDIRRVFDLTAMQAYRQLIEWERIADRAVVLHCFDSMAAGASALTSFGRLFRHLVSLSDDELLKLDRKHLPAEFGTCSLHRSLEPPSGYPTETWQPSQAAEVLAGGNPDADPWRFTGSPRFHKDAREDFDDVERAVVEICDDPMTPRGDTILPLRGNLAGLWRYRLGDRRLVYKPDPAQRVVHLLRIGPRATVYDNL